MIAIDTNALLRYLLDDDRQQSAKAASLLVQLSVDTHTVRTERSRSAVLPSLDSTQDEWGVRILELSCTSSRVVLITDIVLVETLWTLRGKKYNLNKAQLIQVIQQLFSEPNIRFEDGQAVWRALNDYRLAVPVNVGSKRKRADFPDALIINKAHYCVKFPDRLEGVYTFDKAAQKIDGACEP